MDISKLAKPEEVLTIDQLEAEYQKIFYKFDPGVVRIAVASLIANKMSYDPVWLMIIAPSSGGKTEVVSSFDRIPFVEPISEITANTFASGFKSGPGEASLLKRIQNGVLTFKDYTSIISMNNDARAAVLGQLREIYDGEYVKQVGNGEPIRWKGKMGAIAACTEVIYTFDEMSSAKGPRFVYYRMSQPDRIGQARAKMANAQHSGFLREHLQACTKNVVSYIIGNMDTNTVDVGKEFFEKVLSISDFVTLARSGVETDFKSGRVTFAPAAEMPARFAGQMMAIAGAIIAMNKTANLPPDHPCHENKLTEQEKQLVYKTAFDSVPRTKRDPIYYIATYMQGCTSAGLGIKLRLPTDSITAQMNKLAAHDVCNRIKGGGKQGDTWRITERYRKVVQEAEGIHGSIPGVLEAPSNFDEEDFDIEALEQAQDFKSDLLEPTDPNDF